MSRIEKKDRKREQSSGWKKGIEKEGDNKRENESEKEREREERDRKREERDRKRENTRERK